ncbi:hypothetical protein MMC13_005249 [Lambiella insularis]|nr:hypothetical protein [Lambiella insularis]
MTPTLPDLLAQTKSATQDESLSPVILVTLPFIFSYAASASYLPPKNLDVIESRDLGDLEQDFKQSRFIVPREAGPCANAEVNLDASADVFSAGLLPRSIYAKDLLYRGATGQENRVEIRKEFERAGKTIKKGFEKAGKTSKQDSDKARQGLRQGFGKAEQWLKTEAAPWLKDNALEIATDVVSAIPLPGAGEIGMVIKAAGFAEKAAIAVKKGIRIAKKVGME